MKRFEKYPLVCMALTPEEVAELRGFATRHNYVGRTGPQPGGLARDLFRAAMGKMREASFEPRAFAESIETQPVKDWLYRLYEAMPRDRRGALRGLAEAEGFEVPPDEFDEGARNVPKAANASVGRKPRSTRDR